MAGPPTRHRVSDPGCWDVARSVSDPVAYLFKNADPRGSLVANLSNATVRCLSNMKRDRMLEERHEMSRAVREEQERFGEGTGVIFVRAADRLPRPVLRRLSREEHSLSLSTECIGCEAAHRGLPRPIDSLEGHEALEHGRGE